MTANPLAKRPTVPQAAGLAQWEGARVFQFLSVIFAIIAFALLTVRTGGAWQEFSSTALPYAGGVLLSLTIVFGFHFVVTRATYLLRKDSDQQNWYRGYFGSIHLAELICGTLALIATIASFTAFKGMIVGSNGYAYDPLFTQWDKIIFGGQHGWEVTHALFPSTSAMVWLDLLYHAAFFPMVLGYLICLVVQRGAALRHTYMLCYLLSYIVIGMILAAALSSAGPAFDGSVFGDGSTFGPLQDVLQRHREAAATPLSFGLAQDYLLKVYEDQAVSFGAGISAMPSMHMVFAYLFAFAAWHLNRAAGFCIAAYAAVIWLTSVHLGWHYFVDGLVSLGVVGLLWVVLGWTTGLYQFPRQLIRATT